MASPEHDMPILASDAASMLRKRVNKNDKPYTQAVVRLNNKLVDEWKETLLDKISDSQGRVSSRKVWQTWILFQEGKGTAKFMELKEQGIIRHVEDEVLEYWKDFFQNKSVEEMHSYGSGNVSFGWTVIQNALRMRSAEEKWEKIFSRSEDPHDWYKLSFKYPGLIEGKDLPFWDADIYEDVHQKVATVLMVQVDPSN